jgi:hypothetical protein
MNLEVALGGKIFIIHWISWLWSDPVSDENPLFFFRYV